MEFASIAAGDRSAFDTLFRAHYKPLCAFAVQYVKDRDVAEDLVQDLFFRLWQDREKVSITTSLKAYLFTAVRNRSLNAAKVSARMRPLERANIRSASDGMDEEDRHTERAARVHAAIELLPEERRKVFKMSKHDGKKYQEIADELGISIKTVENQMGKALKTLRVELADLLPSATVAWLLWFFGNG
ncbi:MAG: RNA polymerase sigma-70 factor [Flavobacteriales bacterium]|nr:RNA polymerase sigma-70 factor [Flavobacteriales bacterium]MBP6643787.1 RNA polymerase sigma-70 factor [Flavobacteriales bacterium]MBP7154972.1 RNA polymerase sigma-70 factor [Flavobacteriales bacterium]